MIRSILKIVGWFLAFSIIFIFGNILLAQKEKSKSNPPPQEYSFGLPLFVYDMYNFASLDPTKSHLEVYLAFVNDILQFVKENETRYVARYEVMVEILDKKGNHVDGKTWSDEIIVNSFEETNARDEFNTGHASFDLSPGKYKVLIELTDKDTKKQIRREKQVKLRKFTLKKVSLSDVLFADEIEYDSSGIKRVIPNLQENFINPKLNFGTYWEVYPPLEADSVKINFNILDASGESVAFETYTVANHGKPIRKYIDLKSLITLPGRYYLIVQAEHDGQKADAKAKFSINWSDTPFSLSNILSAIEPLKHFVAAKDLKKIERLSDEEKEKWFKEFWKKRDPTPDTEENELMDEFYRRVDFANFHFTVPALDVDGWETDRGNIYIKYGPPTTVEKHLDEINIPPYEIWYYEKIDRRFVFQDRSGVGDFKLVKIE